MARGLRRAGSHQSPRLGLKLEVKKICAPPAECDGRGIWFGGTNGRASSNLGRFWCLLAETRQRPANDARGPLWLRRTLLSELPGPWLPQGNRSSSATSEWLSVQAASITAGADRVSKFSWLFLPRVCSPRTIHHATTVSVYPNGDQVRERATRVAMTLRRTRTKTHPTASHQRFTV